MVKHPIEMEEMRQIFEICCKFDENDPKQYWLDENDPKYYSPCSPPPSSLSYLFLFLLLFSLHVMVVASHNLKS